MFNLGCRLTPFVGVVLLYSISICLSHGVEGVCTKCIVKDLFGPWLVTINMADRPRRTGKMISLKPSSNKDYRFVWDGFLGCRTASKRGCKVGLSPGSKHIVVCVVAVKYDVMDNTFKLIFFNESTPRQRKIFTHLDTMNNVYACGDKSTLFFKIKTDYIKNNNSTVILDAKWHISYSNFIRKENQKRLSTTISVFNETDITSENLERSTTVNVFEESGLSATDPSKHKVLHGNVLLAVLVSVVITVAASVAVCGITIYCVRRLKHKEHQSEQPNDTISFQPNAQHGRVLYPPPAENPPTLQNVLSSTSSIQFEQQLLVQRCHTPEVTVFSEAPPAYDEVLLQGFQPPEVPLFSKALPSYDEVFTKGCQAPEVPVYSDAPPSYDELKV